MGQKFDLDELLKRNKGINREEMALLEELLKRLREAGASRQSVGVEPPFSGPRVRIGTPDNEDSRVVHLTY